MTDIKYYCDTSYDKNSNSQWEYLLEYAFRRADQVEFNILRSDSRLKMILLDFADDIVDKECRKDKIYKTGKFIRFNLSENVKEFIRSKSYNDWLNYAIEDISFLKEGNEFLATITHENYIIVQLEESERVDLNMIGFNFNSEWSL